jgi:hypothetical protein
MDFGVNLVTRGITGNAEGLLSMARQAEALGFGHVTVNMRERKGTRTHLEQRHGAD